MTSKQTSAVCLFLSALAGSSIVGPTARASDPQFKVVPLDVYSHVPAGDYTYGIDTVALNNAGQIALNGHFKTFQGIDDYRAEIYAKGKVTDLGTGSVAYGLNSSGQVAGLLNGVYEGDTAVYTPGSGWTNYRSAMNSAFPGELVVYGRATAINDNGQFSGWAETYDSTNGWRTYATLFDGHTLGAISGQSAAQLNGANTLGINNSGQVVGTLLTDAAKGRTHAFVTSGGVVTDLTPTIGNHSSVASAINDAGAVVGWTEAADYSGDFATLWVNGATTNLGSLDSNGSRAYAINRFGDIVGNAGTRAFLYMGGQMRDLNTLLAGSVNVGLTNAKSINEVGQILASDNHGGFFLLNPVTGDLRVRGTGMATDILGGSHQSGGVTLTAPAGSTGTLRGDFAQSDPAAALPFGAGAVTFGLPTDKLQLWDLSYSGSAAGPLSISLGYDDSLLRAGVSESDLTLYHYTGGQWVAVPALVDAAANTITFTPDGFSPYALGVPEPTLGAFVLAGIASCCRRREKR